MAEIELNGKKLIFICNNNPKSIIKYFKKNDVRTAYSEKSLLEQLYKAFDTVEYELKDYAQNKTATCFSKIKRRRTQEKIESKKIVSTNTAETDEICRDDLKDIAFRVQTDDVIEIHIDIRSDLARRELWFVKSISRFYDNLMSPPKCSTIVALIEKCPPI